MQLKRWSLEEVFDTSDVIGVDFDGTITQGRFPEMLPPRPHIAELLCAIRARGRKVVIWTCRTAAVWKRHGPETHIAAIEAYLTEHEIEVDGILIAEKPVWARYIGDEADNIETVMQDLNAYLDGRIPKAPV